MYYTCIWVFRGQTNVGVVATAVRWKMVSNVGGVLTLKLKGNSNLKIMFFWDCETKPKNPSCLHSLHSASFLEPRSHLPLHELIEEEEEKVEEEEEQVVFIVSNKVFCLPNSRQGASFQYQYCYLDLVI